MLYQDLISPEEIIGFSTCPYLSLERKKELEKALSMTIDDRFSTSKHVIFSSHHHLKETDEGSERLEYVNVFERDQLKIKGSKAFRRLGDKAQVLPNIKEESIHCRNRANHSMEVADYAEIFCDMINQKFQEHNIPIRYNKELCIAIALGHDLGHTPLGHIGEDFIRRKSGKPFEHNIHSTNVAEKIERKGKGLNLSSETLYGILNHSTNEGKLELKDRPQEEAIVRIMDKIAYVFSDTEDGIRQGYIKQEEMIILNKLGITQRERVYTVLSTLVDETFKQGFVTFGDSQVGKIFLQIRAMLKKEYYQKVNEQRNDTANKKLEAAYNFFERERQNTNPVIPVSLLTDTEAIKIEKKLKRKPGKTYQEMIKEYNLGVSEIMPYINGIHIDLETPSLNEDVLYTIDQINHGVMA